MPLLLTALFGGVVADKVDRKRLILTYQSIVTVASLLVAVSITFGFVSWPLLLATSMLQGAAWSFAYPARQALLPNLVGPDKVGNALALNAAGMSTTSLVAPACAGLLYAVMGPDGVFYVTSAMGVLAVALTFAIHMPVAAAKSRSSRVLGDIKEGIAYVLNNHLVLTLLALGLITSMISSPFTFLLPVLVVDVYQRESGSYGLLVSALGMGSVVSALVVASIRPWRRGRLVLLGLLASGTCMVAISMTSVYGAAVVIMLVLGLERGPGIFKSALIIENVADRYRGRVISMMSLNMGFMPLALMPLGLAADLLGGRAVVGIMGAAMLATFAVTITTQKKLRAID